MDRKNIADQILVLLQQWRSDDIAEGGRLCSYLYVHPAALPRLLANLKSLVGVAKPDRDNLQERGRIMEQIGALLFVQLRGWSRIVSYKSAGPQYDLLISGNDLEWLALIKILSGSDRRRSILVEAKATRGKLTDSQMARVCAILMTHLTTAALAVFVTLEGATGYRRNSKTRARTASDCRLRQIVFFAKSLVPIVVLDLSDLERLAAGENLIKLLASRIDELAELAGEGPVNDIEPVEVDLPPHLAEMLGEAGG